MTLKEKIRQIDRLVDFLKGSGFNAVLNIAGKDIAADISMRVRETGKDSEGGTFSPYSPATLAAKRRKGKNILTKNFEDTGRMWAGFDSKTQNTLYGKQIILEGKTQYSQELIDKHSKIEGKSIIKPSEQEIEDLRMSIKMIFEEQIKRILL